jgi:hypothetical protein
MQLKISNTDGTKVYSNDVIKVNVDANGRITDIIYGSTTVSSIPAYTGANAKYEVGILGERGVIVPLLSN